jgi:dienelactone hydrolase
MSLPGFSQISFEHDGVSRVVYRRGNGPGVVVIHEIPGITPEVRRFGERVADAGFTVFLPSLFGTPNKPYSASYILNQVARACISREFSVLASRQSSPITQWLRALCRMVHADIGGKGVGAIGMCLTGNFALALMVDEEVMAPVLSQPSLPFPLGSTRKAALHISDEDLAIVKRRVKNGVPVLGMRFTNDPVCQKERFDLLRKELGDGFEAIEIDSSPGNPWGHTRKAHSVVTKDLVDKEGQPTRQALDRVISFFRQQLIEK